MPIQPASRIRDVTGISEDEKDLIRTFLQGAVYAWVRDNQGRPFAVRDLMGGANFEWEGTPLYVLFLKHRRLGKNNEAAVNAAGRDLGWLVKWVLNADKRTFVAGKSGGRTGPVSTYRWDGNEP